MGEFFEAPKKQESVEAGRRYTTDPNELVMWFNVEIDRCNEVNRQAANTILPDVVFLKGDSKREGKIKVITDRMENEYRMLRSTTIGPDIEHLLVVVERLVMNESNYTQLLSKSVGNLIFMLKNSMEIMKTQKDKIKEIQKEKQETVREIRAEMESKDVQQFEPVKVVEAQEQRVEQMMPEETKSGLRDERRMQLDAVYDEFVQKNKNNKYAGLAFARLINPTYTSNKFTEDDAAYLKTLWDTKGISS